MSKWLTAGVCIVLPLAIFAGTIDHSITLSVSDIRIETVSGYDYISIAGYDRVSEPGHPALPVTYLSFVIPSDAEFQRLEIISEHAEPLSDTYHVFPAQEPVPTSGVQHVEFTQPEPTVYDRDELYPNTPTVQFLHEGSLAGYRIVSVLYQPVHYNPVEQRMYLTENMTFRIHYRRGFSVSKPFTQAQQHLAEKRVRALVVNDQQIGTFAPPVRTGVGTWQSEYIIITDPAFVDAFEPLLDWKMKKGVPAEIVTTSWIYSNYTGNDNAEQMRNFIKAAADSGALYFLLAGQCDWELDEEYVPRRDAYCWTCYQGGWPDEDTIPCDMYFSDLDGNWDADGDGTFGEMEDSVDLYSNVFVGRAPVKDLTQIDNFVSKVIAYETEPSRAYVEKALLAVGNLFQGNHGTGMSDTIADAIPDDWQKAKIYEDYGLMSRYVVRDSIDQGFHLSNMIGHGNQTVITYAYGAQQYYRYSDPEKDPATQVNSENEGVIVTSNSCATAAVDKGWWTTDNDCLAENMVNTNTSCAVAALMNTRYGWSSSIPEGNIDLTDEIIVLFYKTLFDTDAYHLGEVLAATKDHVVPKTIDNRPYRWCLYTFNLFGDPETPVWTDLPDTMQITHDPIVYTGPGTFSVVVEDAQGVPLPDSRVCCYISTQEPIMHATGYTDASGTAVLNVDPVTAGDTMYVTATKHNFVPKQSYALVHESGPYVTSSTLIIDDMAGNLDAKVNPGETIDLGVWARNWGNEVAPNVYGYLSTSDPYTTLGTTESKYNRINAFDSSLSRPYYSFSVAGDCPNRHVITLDIEFRDKDDNTWTSYPNLMVYAPVLNFENVSVLNDYNDDGVLGPGETADLIVTVKNDGDATAVSTIGILSSSSEYVTIIDPFGSFGDIAPGMTNDNSENSFTVTLDPATPYGTEVEFSLIVQSGVYSTTLDFSLTVYPPRLSLLGVQVVNDNGDGLLEPGESAGLVATLTNDGNATADDVTSVLTSSSPYVMITDDAGAFGSIVSGDTADNMLDPYTIMVDSATPGFTDINFTIYADAGPYADTFDFVLTVYVPILEIVDVQVVNDTDGDGAIEPGETADLLVTLVNEGELASHNTTATLQTASSDVAVTDNSGFFGEIQPGDTSDNALDMFTADVSIDAGYFSEADFTLLIEAGLYYDTLDFTMNLGEYPASDTGHYFAYYSSGPHVQSPTFEWIAIDTTQTQYPGVSLDLSGTDDYMTRVDLPFTFVYYTWNTYRIGVGPHGKIRARYRGYYMYADSTNTPIPDPDGSAGMMAGVWDYLEPGIPDAPGDIYYYYDEPNHRFIVEFFQVEHYPGGDPETFEFILYDPAYYPTPTGDGPIVVQYLTAPKQTDITVGIENFHQTIGIQYYYDGVYNPRAGDITDSFAIKYTTYPQTNYPLWKPEGGADRIAGPQAETGRPDATPGQTCISVLYPNPFLTRTTLSYQVSCRQSIRLQVYDAAGRLVRSLAHGVYDPGYYAVHWNGRDDVGRRLSDGVYFVQFESEGYRKVQKAVLVK